MRVRLSVVAVQNVTRKQQQQQLVKHRSNIGLTLGSVGDVVAVDSGQGEAEDPAAVAEMEMLAAMKERERRTYYRQQRRELRAKRIAERQARAAAEGIVMSDADAAKAVVLEAKQKRSERAAAGIDADDDDDDLDLDDFDEDEDDEDGDDIDDNEDDNEDEDDIVDSATGAAAADEDDENNNDDENPF
jgi:hypothetical protein